MVYEWRVNHKPNRSKFGLVARGLCVASNASDLFWQIDRYVDPYSVAFRKRPNLSICFFDTLETEIDCPEDYEPWCVFTDEDVIRKIKTS